MSQDYEVVRNLLGVYCYITYIIPLRYIFESTRIEQIKQEELPIGFQMDLQSQPHRMKRTRTAFKSKESRDTDEEPSRREIVEDRNGRRKVRIKKSGSKGQRLGKKKSKSKHKNRKESRQLRKEGRQGRKEARQSRKQHRQANKENRQGSKEHRQANKENRQARNEERQDELKVEDRQGSKPSEGQKFQKSATQQEKEIKQQQGREQGKKSKSKSKKGRSRTKHKKKKKGSDQVKDEAEEEGKASEQGEGQKERGKERGKEKGKKAGKAGKKSKKRRGEEEVEKAEEIDVDEIKIEEEYNWEANNNEHNEKAKIRKKEMLSFEDSEKIIHLFSLDAGDYRGMRKEMPHIAQRQIRGHLRMLFERSLNMITERVRESGRKIKDWEQYQRREIIRELHRIRSSNRLLSEGNVELRETFLKMMSSFNHPQLELTDTEIAFLYRKIEAFVRGFNHLNFFRKNYYVAPDEEDERRKPIIEGGYIMQSKVKREERKRNESHQAQRQKIDPDQLVLEWTELEERELSILYLKNITNYEHMIENLKTRFGDSDKWRDFQIVGKKIDHLIKLGLDRLQEITSRSYYDPAELMAEERARSVRRDSERRKKIERIKKSGPSTLEDLTSVVYNNKEIIKETREVREGGVIKNPSLLLKQVFAHVESYRVKHRLVDLVVNRYPEEADIQETIRIIKEFTEWANREEEKNGVTLIRSRPPVIDYEHHSQAFSCREDRSVTHINKEEDESAMIFQRGLNYLEPSSPDQKKEYDDSPVYFSAKLDGEYQGVETLSCRSNVVEVFESDESEYEGFVKSTK